MDENRLHNLLRVLERGKEIERQTSYEEIVEAFDAQRRAGMDGEVVVTTDPRDGRCVAVTRQDEEGKILSVVWEAPTRKSDDEATRLLLALCDSNDRIVTTQAWRDAYEWRDRRAMDDMHARHFRMDSITPRGVTTMTGKSISEERREFTPERPEERASEDPEPAEPTPDSKPPEE